MDRCWQGAPRPGKAAVTAAQGELAKTSLTLDRGIILKNLVKMVLGEIIDHNNQGPNIDALKKKPMKFL